MNQSDVVTQQQELKHSFISYDDETNVVINDIATISIHDQVDIDKNSSKHGFMHHSESIVAVADIDTEQQELGKLLHNDVEQRLPPFLLDCKDDNVVNVTSAAGGARILFATDEWFATADNLLKDDPPYFDPAEYCEQGKVMDGWETRRRREAGHDWCIIRLAQKVYNIVGIEVDTAYFTGNNAPAISLEIADIPTCQAETDMVASFPKALQRLLHGCVQGTGHSPEEVLVAEKACHQAADWHELLPKTPLNPGYEATRMHYFTLPSPTLSGTHLRVNYFPDGGVARLRLWGYTNNDTPRPIAGPAYSPIATGTRCTVVSHGSGLTLPSRASSEYIELSSNENGGLGLICSNKHYGEPCNLIQSTYGRDMGDGWETARHPDRLPVLVKNPKTGLVDSPLSDWCILKLGCVAADGVARIILDTKHFRGNYPESVQVEGCYCSKNCDDAIFLEEEDSTVHWFPLIDRVRMAPDSEHSFERSNDQISNADGKISHVRVTIYPDGGLSRVRIYGTPRN